MEEKYPWYELCSVGEGASPAILQGDLIRACPLLVPSEKLRSEGDPVQISVNEYDIVILTQSCDLVQGNVTNVLVAPFFTLNESLEHTEYGRTSKSKKAFFDKVKQGAMPNFHLLNIDPSNGIDDFLLVDFRNVYAIHIDFLTEHIKNSQWVRLNSPYKEHLSQAFARYLMRVGLPMDLRNPF